MGQAFRRATGGRVGSTSKVVGKPVEQHKTPPPPAVPFDQFPTNDDVTSESAGASSRVKEENILEDRDPQYDSMLNQMVGRIRAKPGGKPEMGEASVIENYKRPLPKVRNTTTESTRYEEKPAPPGTLNVAQLRQIILLYQGNTPDDPPMTVPQLAERFRIDAAQVQCILKSVSLPPEDAASKKEKNDNDTN